jgi:ribosomal protein S18 acetylase RimI-like enzyme
VAYAPDSLDTPVAVVSAYNDRTRVELLTVAVQPQYQRRGLASRLIKQAVAHLTNEDEDAVVTAQVSTANQTACDFYEQGLGLSHDGHIIRDAYRKSSAGWRDAYRYTGRI